MWTLFRRLGQWCVWIGKAVGNWLRTLVQQHPKACHRIFRDQSPRTCRRVFARPKPKWVKTEIIRLKALMPDTGCRTIAHHFNRRWQQRRQMTVSKTYVADMCRRHQYLIYEARRKLKHRVPRPIPRNRIWGCDLLTKTDRQGQPHLALAILDHASRACLRLQRLSDKSSWTLLQELVHAVKRYGRPQFLRTDNEAVLVSRLFRLGLWLLGIRQQRIQPGCPWQNGRVERFIGTVKRELARESVSSSNDFATALQEIRTWYNHDRPHDHLQGRTPAEVWAGIDVFASKPG
jgi:transposase InsO family protein